MVYLVFTIILLVVLLLISLYYNYKFAGIIFIAEESIEISLDELNERYRSIQQILNMDVCFNSPEIQKVMEDIKLSKDSLLRIANRLVGIEDGQKEEN